MIYNIYLISSGAPERILKDVRGNNININASSPLQAVVIAKKKYPKLAEWDNEYGGRTIQARFNKEKEEEIKKNKENDQLLRRKKEERIQEIYGSKNMKVTISKSQWEEIGKKAGWTKTAQGKPSINQGAPGSRERVKQEYPNLIKKLEEAKAYGHPLDIAEEILADEGIHMPSLEAKSLLEVSGWRNIVVEEDRNIRDSKIQLLKNNVAKIVDEFDQNLLSKEEFETKMKEIIGEMYKVKGTQPNPNTI